MSISANKIRAEGAVVMSKGLEHCPGLTVLNISGKEEGREEDRDSRRKERRGVGGGEEELWKEDPGVLIHPSNESEAEAVAE